MCIYFLLSPGYWCTSFFFLAGPGLPHEIAVSAFFAKSSGPCKYLATPASSLNPACVSRCFSALTLFLRLAHPLFLSLIVLLYCTPRTPWTSILLGFLLYTSILFRLRFTTSFQLYRLWLTTSFMACSLLSIIISMYQVLFYPTMSGHAHPQFCSYYCISHRARACRYFLAAVICTVSSCYTNTAFSFHTCSAFSRLGPITFIKHTR